MRGRDAASDMVQSVRMRAHEHEAGHVTVVAQHITVCENRATPVSITQVDDVTTERKVGVRVQAKAMPVTLAKYVRVNKRSALLPNAHRNNKCDDDG